MSAADDDHEPREWLAAARDQAGMSQDQLGNAIGVTGKTIANWERGRTTPTIVIRRALAEELGFTLNELNRRLGTASATGPAEVNGNSTITPFEHLTAWLPMYDRAERTAYAIKTFEVTTFAALTQHEDYARAVELSGHLTFTYEEVDHLVKMRTARAAVLDTAEYTALIPEPLLDATKGGPAVMADQMAHLLDLADRPNVTLLVIGYEHLSAAPGPFTLLGTAGPDADTVYEFTADEPLCSQRATRVADRVAAFNHLCSLALDTESSRKAIAKAADRFTALVSMTKGTPA